MAVIANMPDRLAVARREASPAELRRDTIHAHGVALEAIAIAGARAMNDNPNGWPEMLVGLRDVDWSRANRARLQLRCQHPGRVPL